MTPTPTPHPNPIGKPVEEFWLDEEYPFDAPWLHEQGGRNAYQEAA